MRWTEIDLVAKGFSLRPIGVATRRLSIAEPVSQSLPTFSAPRGGITFFRGEVTDALD